MGIPSTSKEPLPPPQPSSPSLNSALPTRFNALVNITSVVFALLSTVLIHNYNPSTARKLESLLFNDLTSVKTTITSPSSSVFLTACSFYALSISSFLNLHKNDRYQPHIIAFGLTLALLGTAIYGHEDGYFMPLKSFVSIYVVGAMLYSSLYHALKPLRQARRDDVIVGRDTKGEQPLKL